MAGTLSRSYSSTALLVLGLCFLFNFTARGVSETYAVFLLPLEAEFGWRRSQLTGVYSVFMLSHGLAAPLAGLMIDRVGPRAIYATGIVCLGGGCLLAARIEALWQFYLAAGILVGLGVAALGMVPASALVGRWFQVRLSSAMGIAYAGLGCGTLAVVPLTQAMIEAGGWRFAYERLGWAVLALSLLLVLPWRRFAAGRHPAGSGDRRSVRTGEQWRMGRLLRDGGFWGLFAVFFFTAFAIFAITPQAVAFLVEVGFAPLTAATAFGLLGLLSVVGVAMTGWLADSLGRRRVVTVSYLCTLVGIATLLVLPHYPTIWLLAVFVIVFGVVMGSRGPVVSTLAARLFPGGVGTAYGLITLGLGLGAGLGSWLAGVLHDWTGDYMAGFGLAAAATLAALLQFWLVPGLKSDAGAAPATMAAGPASKTDGSSDDRR